MGELDTYISVYRRADSTIPCGYIGCTGPAETIDEIGDYLIQEEEKGYQWHRAEVRDAYDDILLAMFYNNGDGSYVCSMYF